MDISPSTGNVVFQNGQASAVIPLNVLQDEVIYYSFKLSTFKHRQVDFSTKAWKCSFPTQLDRKLDIQSMRFLSNWMSNRI